MMYGIAPLAAGRFKSVVLANHPDGFGISVFTKVDGFGDGLQVVKELLAKKKNKIPFAELNLCWDDDHNYTTKYYTHVKSEAKRARAVIEANPNVKFYVIPVTEDNLKIDAWLKFHNLVAVELKGLANVTIVHSPIKKVYFKGFLNVFHDKHGGDAFNYDGTNCFDADVQADKDAYANEEYFLLWCPQCNGNRKVFKPGEKRGPLDFKERSKRVFWPTKEHYQAMAALAKPKGKTKNSLKGLIPKSVSDQHTPKPQGKDCKPVYITPLDFSPQFLELKKNGKVIAKSDNKLPYNEKNPDGSNGKQVGWRYYFSKQWGYQIANEPLELFGGGKLIAILNPTFRDFVFR